MCQCASEDRISYLSGQFDSSGTDNRISYLSQVDSRATEDQISALSGQVDYSATEDRISYLRQVDSSIIESSGVVLEATWLRYDIQTSVALESTWPLRAEIRSSVVLESTWLRYEIRTSVTLRH